MNRIRKIRKSKNLTLKELSNQLSKDGISISPDAIAKYERGEREPKIERWKKMADFFNVSITYLEGIEDKAKNDSVNCLKFKDKKDAIACIHKIMKAYGISKKDL